MVVHKKKAAAYQYSGSFNHYIISRANNLSRANNYPRQDCNVGAHKSGSLATLSTKQGRHAGSVLNLVKRSTIQTLQLLQIMEIFPATITATHHSHNVAVAVAFAAFQADNLTILCSIGLGWLSMAFAVACEPSTSGWSVVVGLYKLMTPPISKSKPACFTCRLFWL